MTKLSKSITSKIKKESIEQVPYWQFILKHGAFWGVFTIAALIGAAAFSVLLFVLLELDFEALNLMQQSKLDGVLSTLPLLWMLFFLLFFGVALYGVRHTKNGYRFSIPKLVIANLLGSFVLGGFAYGFGGGEHFEEALGKRIPGYKGFEKHQAEMWSHPEKGLLGGKIIEINEQKLIVLEDFSKTTWEVTLPETSEIPERLLQRIESENFKGKKIKIMGEQTGENTFSAEHIQPWRRKMPPFRKDGDRPEEHLQKMMEIHQAHKEGDMEKVKQLHEEMGMPFPPPHREKRRRNNQENFQREAPPQEDI